MSLLTDYGAANRVIDSDLSITYSRQRTYSQWSYWGGPSQQITFNYAWEFTRRAKKSYRYVGMTREAANTCAAAMTALYRREKLESEWNDTGENAGYFTDADSNTVLMADVSVQHDEGSMYSVVISVDEVDTKLRSPLNVQFGLPDPEDEFDDENERDYDTD